MQKIILWFFFMKIGIDNCNKDSRLFGISKSERKQSISKVGTLPSFVNESSGLCKATKGNLYTINDGGGKTELYELDSVGNFKNSIFINNSKNTDWEEIAKDDKENIYIGDFGNNNNDRTDLVIYKYNPEKDSVSKINFIYGDQMEIPYKKENRNFDCEAFFWKNDSLFLFSKNRGDKLVKMYALPDKAGVYKIYPKAKRQINAQITAATISPDAKTYLLLSYGKLYIFGIEKGQINFEKPIGCIKLSLKQAEAITFITNSELMISNEQGELYKLTIFPTTEK